MSIRVALDHTTVYRYDEPVTLSPHVVRLRPAAHCRTTIESYSLKVSPAEHFINWQQDPFGNYLARLVFPEKARELSITVDLIAELTVINPFDFFVEESAEHFPFTYDDLNRRELAPYLEVGAAGALLGPWLEANRPAGETPIIDALVAINQAVQRSVAYRVRMEPGVQPSEQTLDIASGSCRDSGWLLVEILRHYGLAARFVSGYLVQLTADIKSLDGASGPAADFTDLHAWTEVYLPGAGWVGLDPTSGLFAGEGHIPLACTPQPMSAAPISGMASSAASDFHFHNRVTRIDERPRVTLPYTDHTWQRILELGQSVDTRLDAQDVRLTMGGEPTFVSTDDRESAEWNNAALGEHKLERAVDLLGRLRAAWAPNGVPAFAQGKWYPGEPTPRWALICHWRNDGEAVLNDPAHLALPGETDYDASHAKGLAKALADRLGIDKERFRPLHEDPLHHLHLESLLPPSRSLADLDLSDSRSRTRLVEQLAAGLDKPAAWLLPLEHDAGRWKTSEWPIRRHEIFLAPGDSPAGLRLPLDSLPEEDEVDAEARAMAEDNFDADTPLPSCRPTRTEGASAAEAETDAHATPTGAATTAEDAGHLVRTALCVEHRDGSVYVFLPPLRRAAAWVELMAIIEDAAVQAGVRPVIEGYEPPHDARLQSFRLTPDPGVIEVNVHPATSFREIVERTESLFEAARASRLMAEKFMVDGRHTGTGGGNHITFGGRTPADSPFLRRPHLLGSLIRYWQHHPSLSYLFSGMFIGPTSQAPRVDEARTETLYELDMALSRLPDGESNKPWLVDRLLRNLLIDVTGNTHRAEICIDKLYSPGGPAGRLGIVELRAFEMPPHARMAIAQSLLMRCLISRFWDDPYKGELIRWGTELHDRFMLPHYLWADINDVIEDIAAHGMPFDPDWLEAFWEFRFPVYGVRQVGDITLELRAAIEPWHVLGEEAAASGMARYVDSSVERIQLKVTGLTDARYRVTCNGKALPMRSTGTRGEYVVGVRYRAWAPPFSLHPDLPVDVPLVFDVVDTWKNRSLGGCSYHVGDPGGRSYEDVPVNANVAESRRLARFDPDHHTPAPATVMAPVTATGATFTDTVAGSDAPIFDVMAPSTDYPCTADLRSTR